MHHALGSGSLNFIQISTDMKKLFLCCVVLYFLTEGQNIIADGLWVYHRASRAVEDLSEAVDHYYPKVKAADSVMTEVIEAEMADSIKPPEPSPPRQRRIIRR